MTDRERNQFACALAEPLWESGYETRWRCHWNAATQLGDTTFRVETDDRCVTFAVTDEFMLRIRTLELARHHVLRHVERQMALP
jgi:hypothetical protein